MKKLTLTLVFAAITMMVSAQTQLKKVYDETVNPIEQISYAKSVATGALGAFVLPTS